MFRLSESDYRRLEPLAVKVYKRSAKSAHVARLMESKIGRRALVDMMFLEEDQNGSEDNFSKFVDAINDINLEEVANIFRGLQEIYNQLKPFYMNDLIFGNNATEVKDFVAIEQFKEVIEQWKDKTDELEARIDKLGILLANADANIKNLEKNLFRESKRSARYLIEKIRSTKNPEQLAKIIKEAKELTDDRVLNFIIKKAQEDPRYAKAIIKVVEDKKLQLKKETEESVRETLKFKNRVKFYFARIGKWFKGKLNPILKAIFSFFVEKGPEDGFTIKWAHVAIVVAVIAVIGFALFGPYGRQIKNFLFNALKTSVSAVKSAVRYVLGKSGAPKEVVDETEDFLDEATA
jgi:uncharacterized protein YeeX (DUF496 family)